MTERSDRFAGLTDEIAAHRGRFAASAEALRNLPEFPDSFGAALEILRTAGVK